jgi:magnesium transporter
MPAPTPHRSPREIPIVLATTALVSFASVSRAAALALADLGVAAFFVGGVAKANLGDLAPWFVLAAVLVGLAFRAVDIESWALFIPGGLVGRVQDAFGPRGATIAAAAVLVERLLFTALACVVLGHYCSAVLLSVGGGLPLHRAVIPEDLSTLFAVALLGFLWVRTRRGSTVKTSRVVRNVWIAVSVLTLLAVWAIATLAWRGQWPALVPQPPAGAAGWLPGADWREQLVSAVLLLGACLAGLGQVIPAVGSGEGLARVASQLQPPRIRGLRRTAFVVGAYALLVIVATAFCFAVVVPAAAQISWFDAPLAGLALHVSGPAWLRALLATAVLGAAALMLAHAAEAGLSDAHNTLLRLAQQGIVPDILRLPHPQFGTLARGVDTVAATVVLSIIVSGGRVAWLSRAYAVGLVWTLVLKVAALVWLRARTGTPPSFRVPVTWRIAGREWPVGLMAIGLGVLASGLAMLASGDVATLAGTGIMVGLATMFALSPAGPELTAEAQEPETFQLLPAKLSIEQTDARPGNVLVAVRNPHTLLHLSAALKAAGDRDVVVMTTRLLGVDAADDGADDPRPTPSERLLFARVLAIAERDARPVRLLVVPDRDVPDSIIATALRLDSSEVHVGESQTISADAQATLLGEAWERAPKAGAHNVRLVVHHRTGRSDAYHLGAHAPALTPADLELIHTVWLDAAKAVGTQVHHHDVVRAALVQLARQLEGPDREAALRAIREVAKPADELAAVVRTRDFSQLRDMVRNRPPSDLAALITALSPEDQVIVFRLLPRKDAAATFEYLSHDARTDLLKAMAQEEVAALLNDMAPDERTMFLEELPATVTRELLALLTPQERAVALTLLGYPEGSIGRLMTPNYLAVREDWTIPEVLAYVRTHGKTSETINVLYVVDEHGLLVDDIRIREFLLTAPTHRVADLMDRRFVSLRATDDQETAVASFRRYDRVALPVTDTSGVLIGIVTIDDVLDIAEETATKEIQKIGGLEALDEPYMQIALGRMIRKRAGWLTALFLGEMLTATAMSAFEAEIEKAVVLALFVPLIISSGGNSGSQASTLVIRALALQEVGLRDWWRVVRREIGSGFALGAILGSIGFLRITLWSAFSSVYGVHWLLVATTVGVALVGIVMWGTLIGSLLPFVLRRLGFDPATSSAPFVATLVDVTGLVIYFTVAMVVLRGTLL